MIEMVRETILSFCREFVESPYLYYTEHGQHARFYHQVYQSISEEKRYLEWNGQKVSDSVRLPQYLLNQLKWELLDHP